MTQTVAAITCPGCAAGIPPAPSCPRCDLPLRGPVAGALWTVDQRLASLDGERADLLRERGRLLAQLRGTSVVPAQARPAPRPEASPQSVQNLLLGLGALLLAVAGLVFAAVTYRALGAGGRAAVLVALTLLAAYAPVQLIERGLTASAEALAALTAVLGGADAYALRRAGLAQATDSRHYAAVAAVVGVGLLLAYGTAVHVRTARIAAALLLQAPAVLLLVAADASASTTALVLTGLGAVDLLLTVLDEQVARLLTVLAGVALLGALAASVVAVADDQRAGAYGLLALAVVVAAGSLRVEPAALAVPPLLAGAAWAVTGGVLTSTQRPLAVAATALVCLQAVALLGKERRTWPTGGALLVVLASLGLVAGSLGDALVGPFQWLGQPWTLTAHSARDAISPDRAWTGTVVTLVVLVTAAGSTLAAGLVLSRWREALSVAGGLLVVSALVLPLGLATSFPVALGLVLLVATGLGAAGVALRDRGSLLVAAGLSAVALAAVWSTAEQRTTLVVLPVVVLLAATAAVRLPGVPTGLAVLAAGAELAATGAAQHLAGDQVGGLLLVAPAVAVALSYVLRGDHRTGVEGAAVVLGAVSVVLALPDLGWLSWVLALEGLIAVAASLRADRRLAAVAGGLLLTASSWVRLADAHVHAPEPYVVPLAAVALLLGLLRRRTDPGLRSLEAYGAGLSLALVPTLLKALDDQTATRGVLLLIACALVVLAGVSRRLQAPLLVGSTVLVIDAVHLLAPYASALPRWLVLAGAGIALVAVGITYEQRVKDLGRARARFDALG